MAKINVAHSASNSATCSCGAPGVEPVIVKEKCQSCMGKQSWDLGKTNVPGRKLVTEEGASAVYQPLNWLFRTTKRQKKTGGKKVRRGDEGTRRVSGVASTAGGGWREIQATMARFVA
jgi:hypothetical protein